MRQLFSFLLLIFSVFSPAQKEFHVFPIDGAQTKGSPNGDGSVANPWDLQTALSQTSQRINGGDIIWLHKGIYNGNYKSTIKSTIDGKYITVSAYKDHKVIINGNVAENESYVLKVSGDRVVFKNIEITYLGDFSRQKSDKNFKAVTGINHIDGKDCKFQNLVVYNIPGSGIGSWKLTGGTIIEDCIIYNNGYQGQRGHGVGIYIQNEGEKFRIIRNNVIFNNYYKGVEVWSATSGTNREFVKNVSFVDNVVFNNGSPSGKPWANLIIASGDANGINVAKNIKVKNNVFYHNTDFSDYKNFGYGNSITLGYTSKAPVENISILNNIIVGRNNALNLMHIKSAEFRNNSVYSGYVHFDKSSLKALEAKNIISNNNTFYTRKGYGFRILKHTDYNLSMWQNTFNLDKDSDWKQLKYFDIQPVLKIQKSLVPNEYNVVLLQKNGNDVTVDFTDYNIKKGSSFKIYDLENRNVVVKSGELFENNKIIFPMGLKAFEKPLHNTVATKSADNFGVYRIVFDDNTKKQDIFKRIFGWLF
ncbi:MAG: right-handed parallel beta-helix repeat-containing protein [Winogradskyella sp.]